MLANKYIGRQVNGTLRGCLFPSVFVRLSSRFDAIALDGARASRHDLGRGPVT